MFFLVEHTQHTVSNTEAAEDIDGSEYDSEHTEELRPKGLPVKESNTCSRERAHKSYARECVHTRHKRRMEKTRHVTDNEIADNSTDDKDGYQD